VAAPIAPPVPHHFVITIETEAAAGVSSKTVSREGVVLWQRNETRQDQFCKVVQSVNQELRAEGITAGFVTTFWSLHPNRL
jgi:hypothetical protein